MESPADPSVLRIGELSRRVGVSGHVLRAWEARYGLLDPVRSPGGFRLYSESDERRVRRMKVHLAQGLSAAEAARAALAEGQGQSQAQPASDAPTNTSAPARATDLVELSNDWQRALDDFDEPAAQAALDRLLSEFSVATTLRDVVLPYLHTLGERWTARRCHHRPGAFRQQRDPRTAGGAGPRLGKWTRPDGNPCLPSG